MADPRTNAIGTTTRQDPENAEKDLGSKETGNVVDGSSTKTGAEKEKADNEGTTPQNKEQPLEIASQQLRH